MKQQFHLNKQGIISPCNASTPESCPLKSAHYDSLHEAEIHQESLTLSKISRKNDSSPAHLRHEPLTREKALTILPPSSTELNGYMIGGSVLYNLDTPESDVDNFLLTGHYDKNISNASDTQDIQTNSVNSFLKSLEKSAPEAVDRVISGKLQMSDSPWRAMIYNTQFNPYRYNARRLATVETQIQTIHKSEPHSERTMKFVKRALKEVHLHNRLNDSSWQKFTPVFTNDERQKFFHELNSIKRTNSQVDPDYFVNFLRSRIS